MMNGKPQTLTSKFKISYNLLLNLLDNGDNNLINFASRSMITGDINSQLEQLNNKISGLNVELSNIKTCANNLRTPNDILEQYIDLQKNKLTSVNKKRKEIERNIQQIQDNHKFIEQDKITYQKITLKEKEIYELEKDVNDIKSYIKSEVGSVLSLLNDEAYIEGDLNDESSIKLTLKGKIASQLRETHCLVFANLLENNDFDNLTSKQLVSLFSIFTNISVQEDNKTLYPNSEDEYVQKNVILLTELYENYKDKELKYKIDSGVDYNIHYDLLNYVDKWCETESVEDCKMILQDLGIKKEIFLGEFVKALLKINNISCEMEKIAELTGNILFLSKLKEIPTMILKYVVTNQSLYV